MTLLYLHTLNHYFTSLGWCHVSHFSVCPALPKSSVLLSVFQTHFSLFPPCLHICLCQNWKLIHLLQITHSPLALQPLGCSAKTRELERQSMGEVTASEERSEAGASSHPDGQQCNILPIEPLCHCLPQITHKTTQLRRNKLTTDAAKTRCQGKWFHQV